MARTTHLSFHEYRIIVLYCINFISTRNRCTKWLKADVFCILENRRICTNGEYGTSDKWNCYTALSSEWFQRNWWTDNNEQMEGNSERRPLRDIKKFLVMSLTEPPWRDRKCQYWGLSEFGIVSPFHVIPIVGKLFWLIAKWRCHVRIE